MGAVRVSERCLLAIDLGTTSCRCVAFDLNGRVLGWSREEITVDHPRPTWAEVDPEAWWSAACRTVRNVFRQGRVTPSAVEAVGLCGLMHAPVVLGGDGQPLLPAMLWLDQRCAAEAAWLRQAAARPGAGRMGTSATAAKLRWIHNRRPDVLSRARHLLLPKDFLRFRLTGAPATDPSDASGTGMYDGGANAWSGEMVDLVGLPPRALPGIRSTTELAGGVRPRAAVETGIPAGTPVAVGGADTLCTGLGAGPLPSSAACLYLGTAAWVGVPGDPWPGGCPRMRVVASSATTGAVVRWLRDVLWADSYDQIADLAASVAPGADGLFLLPHLMGERSPQLPAARGGLVGFTLHHGPRHMARAAFEGTSFHMRRMLSASIPAYTAGTGPSPVVVCGGGAQSALWAQILADVTGLPLVLPEVPESASLGAAMVAAAAAGIQGISASQERMCRSCGTVAPEPARARTYADLYDRYCEVDDVLNGWHAGSGADPVP